MSTEQNKTFVIEMTAALNSRDWNTALAEYLDPAAFEDFKSEHAEFRNAFPDYHATIEEIVAEGDRVSFLIKAEGTFTHEYPHAALKGIRPTGKRLEWHEASFIKLANGKIVDWKFLVDDYDRLHQLGLYE